MSPRNPIPLRPVQASMIAPCGMNCSLCIGHLRDKNRCPGCNHRDDQIKAGTCRQCSIKLCQQQRRPNRFCFRCTAYPCRRLRELDKRYRTRYGMSMLENLESIRAHGIRAFVAHQKARWTCPKCGALLCVHRPACLHCGHPRSAPPPP